MIEYYFLLKVVSKAEFIDIFVFAIEMRSDLVAALLLLLPKPIGKVPENVRNLNFVGRVFIVQKFVLLSVYL